MKYRNLDYYILPAGVSQLDPVNFDSHWHVYEPNVFTHVPPFLHGDRAHSSTSKSQNVPW